MVATAGQHAEVTQFFSGGGRGPLLNGQPTRNYSSDWDWSL